jgi:hypothetical protein
MSSIINTCVLKDSIATKKSILCVHKSLVGSVVIDAELGREDHNSIPATAIEGG